MNRGFSKSVVKLFWHIDYHMMLNDYQLYNHSFITTKVNLWLSWINYSKLVL